MVFASQAARRVTARSDSCSISRTETSAAVREAAKVVIEALERRCMMSVASVFDAASYFSPATSSRTVRADIGPLGTSAFSPTAATSKANALSGSLARSANNGDGWAVTYYSDNQPNYAPASGDASDALLIDSNFTRPVGFQRIEPTLQFVGSPAVPNDFNPTEGGSPGSANRTAYFTARWTGDVVVPASGWYTFLTSSAHMTVTFFDPTHLDASGNPTPLMLRPGFEVGLADGASATPWVVTDKNGAPLALSPDEQYRVQVDYEHQPDTRDAKLLWAASSTEQMQEAGNFDALSPQLVPSGRVSAPVPAFQTVDASGTLAKDQPYYSFSAVGGDSSVLLRWNSIAADSYNLYRATAAGGPFTLITNLPNQNGAPLAYLDSGLSNGTKYSYILTGVSAEGETLVNLANGSTAGLTAYAEPQNAPPTTVSQVTVKASALHGLDTATPTTDASVVFQSVPFATQYIISRSNTADGVFSPVATVRSTRGQTIGDGSSITYVDSSLPLGSNYYYKIQSAPTSAYSDSVLLDTVHGTVDNYYSDPSWGSGAHQNIHFDTGYFFDEPVSAARGRTTGGIGPQSLPAGGDAINFGPGASLTPAFQGALPSPNFVNSDPSQAAPFGSTSYNYSMVFTGKVTAPTTGTYTFDVGSDLSGELFIDGRLVSTFNFLQGPAVDKAISLTAGQSYSFVFFVSHYTGSPNFHMRWATPSDSNILADVPTQYLTLLDSAPAAPTDLKLNSASLDDVVNIYSRGGIFEFTNNASNAIRNELQRSSDPSFSTDVVDVDTTGMGDNSSGSAQLVLKDFSAQPDKTYYYRVKAANYYGASYSNILKVFTAPAADSPLSTEPIDLQVLKPFTATVHVYNSDYWGSTTNGVAGFATPALSSDAIFNFVAASPKTTGAIALSQQTNL